MILYYIILHYNILYYIILYYIILYYDTLYYILLYYILLYYIILYPCTARPPAILPAHQAELAMARKYQAIGEKTIEGFLTDKANHTFVTHDNSRVFSPVKPLPTQIHMYT